VGKIKDEISITADAVYTDESNLYKRMPENTQKHETVNHSAKESEAVIKALLKTADACQRDREPAATQGRRPQAWAEKARTKAQKPR
jgi:hypothetical protein